MTDERELTPCGARVCSACATCLYAWAEADPGTLTEHQRGMLEHYNVRRAARDDATARLDGPLAVVATAVLSPFEEMVAVEEARCAAFNEQQTHLDEVDPLEISLTGKRHRIAPIYGRLQLDRALEQARAALAELEATWPTKP